MFVTLNGGFRLNTDFILGYEPAKNYVSTAAGTRIHMHSGQQFVASESPEEIDAILAGGPYAITPSHSEFDSSRRVGARSRQPDNAESC